MGFGQIVDQNSDEKKMGVKYRLYWIVDQDCEVYDEKKMGVGQIVEQNSDKKDGCKVLILLNSRLGLWRC